jgi:membrane protease YdiL (CAAX protease family)
MKSAQGVIVTINGIPMIESVDRAHMPPQPAPVPWMMGDVLRAVIFLFIGMVGLGLVAALLVRLMAVDPATVGGMSSPLLFGLGVGAYLLVLLAVYLFAVRRPNSSWQALGVRPFGRGWWPALAVIFPLQLAALGLVNTLLAPFITGGEFENPQVEVITGGMSLDAGDLILLLFLIAGLAPIAEELFFRGMLYPLLRQRWGPGWGIVLNAAIFALIHFIPVLLPGLFVIGLVLSWVRERSDSVIPGILLHAAQNGLVVVGLYLFMNMPAQ